MATRLKTGHTVFDEAVNRLAGLYEQGHELVVSFSAGKDSGVCVEVAILAARLTGRLPVKVVMRDEEVMYPGTFEYAERTAQRDEVEFKWLVANQPVVNVFNREQPYWWVFDPELPADDWVRQPPPYAEHIGDLNIISMTTPERWGLAEGTPLYAVIGLRVQESRTRLYGLYSSKGYVTKPNKHGVRNVWPIYDWTDGDVWRAVHENGWDYNRAYDVMHRMGIPRSRLRIAPPTLNAAGAEALRVAAKAWPQWFGAVARRLPGARMAAHFGKRAIMPRRRSGEPWQDCFHRECITEAPEWVADRAREVERVMLSLHRHHSTTPLPEVEPCHTCKANIGSWKAMALAMWGGDPFCLRQDILPYVEPEFFRPGAGTWGGKPSF